MTSPKPEYELSEPTLVAACEVVWKRLEALKLRLQDGGPIDAWEQETIPKIVEYYRLRGELSWRQLRQLRLALGKVRLILEHRKHLTELERAIESELAGVGMIIREHP